MCGRFTLTADAETLMDYFDLPALAAPVLPRFNIAPTQPVPVVRLTRSGQRQLDLLHWGLIPSWSKDRRAGGRLINARAETVHTKPSFRQAFGRRRCLVLADGFYEWRRRGGSKEPLWIRLRSGEPFAFAGLWERWVDPAGEKVDSCTIITTAPNELVARVHDRMPVMLDPTAFTDWLRPDTRDLTGLRRLLVAIAADQLEAVPVGPQVNRPDHDEPDCIRPVGPPLSLD